MFDFNHRVNIAARRKIACDFDLERIASSHKVIQNLIHRFFVGNIAIAVAVDIQLQRLQFHHALIGRIGEVNGGKVGIARKRTFAGEFWQGDLNAVAPTNSGVGEGN